MPIEIKYGASPAAIGLAGYAAGQNRSRAKYREQMLPYLANQQRMQQQQGQWQQEMNFRRQGFDRQLEQDDARMQLQKRQLQQRQDLADQDWQQRRDLAEFELQGRMDLEQFQTEQQGLADGTFYYTPDQKQELARINEAMTQVPLDDRLTEEQQQEAMAKLKDRQRRIRPIPKPADERPKPMEEQVREKVFWDGGKWGVGTPWTVDAKTGDLQVPRGYKAPEIDDPAKDMQESAKRQFDVRKLMVDYQVKLMGMNDAEGNPKFTPDQAWAEAEKRFGPMLGAEAAQAPPAEAAPPPAEPPAAAAPQNPLLEDAIAAGESALGQEPPPAAEPPAPEPGLPPLRRANGQAWAQEVAQAAPVEAEQAAEVPMEVLLATQVLTELMRQYGNKIPAEERARFDAAAMVYKTWKEQSR